MSQWPSATAAQPPVRGRALQAGRLPDRGQGRERPPWRGRRDQICQPSGRGLRLRSPAERGGAGDWGQEALVPGGQQRGQGQVAGGGGASRRVPRPRAGGLVVLQVGAQEGGGGGEPRWAEPSRALPRGNLGPLPPGCSQRAPCSHTFPGLLPTGTGREGPPTACCLRGPVSTSLRAVLRVAQARRGPVKPPEADARVSAPPPFS